MSKDTEKTPGTKTPNPNIEYLSWWGFALVWVKVISIVGGLALILKYIFKLPIF